MTSTVPKGSDTKTSEWRALSPIPLGSIHGGVWRNPHTEPMSWGATCPACDWWRTFFASSEAAYAALKVHQRRQCTVRRDGGDE